MVVVDRLSKYAHFGALKTGFDAPRVARLFVDTVVKLHGFPKKLLADRDSIFMSDFWKELTALSGTKLQFTTAYHPQTDGQSEVTNRALEQYLRAYTFECPHRWSQMLPWAELALNCSTNVSIGMSPYQALYGREPPTLFDTYARPSHNVSVTEMLKEREDLLRTLKARIRQAQLAMATQANRHRKNVEFEVGDRVWLRLQPYRQFSVGKPLSAKLGRRFYGPYKIVERIGKVAYRLQLPTDSRIHDVFHVSLLKPFVEQSSLVVSPLPLVSSPRGRPLDTPLHASDQRTVLVNGVPQEQWLVHWASNVSASPSWQPVESLLQNFPNLHLGGKVVRVEEGVDRDSAIHVDPDNLQSTAEQEERAATGRRGRSRSRQSSVKRTRPQRSVRRPARFADE